MTASPVYFFVPGDGLSELPTPVAAWLYEQRQSYKNPCAGDPSLVLPLEAEDLSPQTVENALRRRGMPHGVALDISYPFISPQEILQLQRCAEAGETGTLRTHQGRLAGYAQGLPSKNANAFILPEFRSLRVRTLEGWLIAREVEKNWPLFYFNSGYVDYWQKRLATSETSSDKIAAEDVFAGYFATAASFMKTDVKELLDIGCGHGRFFPLFTQYGFAITGIDISWQMVELARRSGRSKIYQATIEHTGLPEESFGLITAWGVFDCADQNVALHHLLGRLRIGGVLLISGKNAAYLPDDLLAIDAEEGAAAKLFPNGFTEFRTFEKAVQQYGGEIADAAYGLYRGDLACGKTLKQRPPQFYDWVAVIRKALPTPAAADMHLVLSHKRSCRNYEKQNPEQQ